MYLKNRQSSFFINKELDINSLNIDSTVLINFGLSNEEEAIYKYNESNHFIKNFDIRKNNMIKLNKRMQDFKKIYILNMFNHFKTQINESNKENEEDNQDNQDSQNIEANLKDFFISDISDNPNIHEKSIMIFKNSPNAFISPGFSQWITINVNTVNTFVISGFSFIDDIFPFINSLLSYYREWGLECNVIVDFTSVYTASSLNKVRYPDLYTPIIVDLLANQGVIFIDNWE